MVVIKPEKNKSYTYGACVNRQRQENTLVLFNGVSKSTILRFMYT